MARTSHAPGAVREVELFAPPGAPERAHGKVVLRKELAPEGLHNAGTPIHGAQPQVDGDTGKLSQTFWGLRFEDYLPLPITDRVTARVREWRDVQGFLLRTAPQLVEKSAGQRSSRMEAAKARFFEQYSDVIELYAEGETVGVFIGEPSDWSTYYCRALTISKSAGPSSVIRKFTREAIVKPLTDAGVERMVADTLPTNRIMVQWLTALGFQPSGQHLTDRWGTLVRFTRFLDKGAAESFARRYSANG